ncbi:hypothetical protein D3C78_375870 [compost metagenome]
MGDAGMADGVRRQGTHLGGILGKAILLGQAGRLLEDLHHQIPQLADAEIGIELSLLPAMGRSPVAHEERRLFAGGWQRREPKKGAITCQCIQQGLGDGHGAAFAALAAWYVIAPDPSLAVAAKLAHDGAEARSGRHLGDTQITGVHEADEKPAALMLGRAFGCQPLGSLHHIGPLQFGKGLGLFTGILAVRPLHPLQQERWIAVHVLFLDQELEEGRQYGELGLHRLLAQTVWQLAAQFPLAEKRSPQGVGQALSPLLVEHELGHISVCDKPLWRSLAVVEVAHHDAPGEILWADGHLAETPMQEGGQLAAVGLVVVLAVALLQQPVDGQLIDEAGIGDIAQAESGQILVDLGIARLQMEQIIEQRHGGWQ